MKAAKKTHVFVLPFKEKIFMNIITVILNIYISRNMSFGGKDGLDKYIFKEIEMK